MSVLTRIRIIGAIAASITSALGLFGAFWLVSFFDVIPGSQSRWLSGALLMGLPLCSLLCLLLALSIDASQRRLQRTRDSSSSLSDADTFDASSFEAGRV